MPKVKLDKAYIWRGRVYEAGEQDVPEGLALALEPSGILSAEKAEKADADAETSTKPARRAKGAEKAAGE